MDSRAQSGKELLPGELRGRAVGLPGSPGLPGLPGLPDARSAVRVGFLRLPRLFLGSPFPAQTLRVRVAKSVRQKTWVAC